MDKLFEVKEGLFQVVRPCTDNGVFKEITGIDAEAEIEKE